MKDKIFNTFLIKISSAVLSFFTVVLLSQVLGAEGRGEASIILTTISVVMIFSEFTSGALVYLIPRNNLNSLLLTCYSWSLGISSVAFFLLINTISFSGDYFLHISILAFWISVASINSKILIARERIGQNNLVQFTQVMFGFLGLIVLFYFFNNKSVSSYVISLYIGIFFSCMLSLLFIYPDLRKEKISGIKFMFKETLSYGAKNQLAHISQFLSFRASYYIIEKFWGNGMVGIYSNGVSIAESIWIVSKSVALVQYSKITNTDDEEYSRTITINLTKTTIVFSILLLIPLLLLPASFYEFLFGKEFGALPIVILALAPGIVFFSVALIVGHYFSGIGKYEINAIASTAGLVVTLVLGFILIPFFPIWGAALTASLSYFTTAFIVVYIFF